MAGVYGTRMASVQQAAECLAPFCDGANPADIAAYLSHLGGIGPGLYEMLQQEQSVGSIFRVIFNLSMLSDMVLANHYNCQRLGVLGHDVLVVLDNAGRRGAAVRLVGLEALTACFEDICQLVDAFTQPGWLLRLACDMKLREEFETLHQAVLELVRGEGLLSLAGARPPVGVDYRDIGRQLRRTLKQMGSGSLTAGVQHLRVSDKSRVEVARLLGIHYRVVKQELASLPQSDLELSTIYQQLLQPSGVLQAGSNNGTPSSLSEAAASKSCTRPSSRASSHRVSVGDTVAGNTDLQAAAAELGRSGSNSSFSLSMNGPAAASLYGDLFRWYDKDKSGALEADELQAALADLGMLDGKSGNDAREMTAEYMRIADAAAVSRREGIGFDAFCKFYEMLVMAKARQQLRFKLGLQVEEDLWTAFLCFASFGSREPVNDMDGAHFQKLCRDCGLLDRHTGPTEVDLVFTYVKTKGVRRISFEQFLTALAKLAERKGIAFEDVVMKVLTAGGPIANATMAGHVRLHDDKATYTGVYSRGGPSKLDQSPLELANMVNRLLPESSKRMATSPSNAGSGNTLRRSSMRSVGGLVGSCSSNGAHMGSGLYNSTLLRANSAGSMAPFATYSRSPTPRSGHDSASRQASRRASGTATAPAGSEGFLLYGGNSRRLSGAAAGAAAAGGEAGAGVGVGGGGHTFESPFSAIQAGHTSRRASSTCTPSVVDSSGQHVATSSNGHQAQNAGNSLGRASSGNSLAPTLGSSSRWYSQSLLGPTGTAAAASAAAAAAAATAASSRRCSRDAAAVDGSNGAAVQSSSKQITPGGGPAAQQPGEVQLRDVFAAFAGFGIRSPGGWSAKTSSSGAMPSSGDSRHMQQPEAIPSVFKPLVLEMDGFRFVKLCREARLFDDNFTSTGADIIFTKVKSKGAKKINYAQFMTALSLIASVKKLHPQQLVQEVLGCGGPTLNSAFAPADLQRVHDSR